MGNPLSVRHFGAPRMFRRAASFWPLAAVVVATVAATACDSRNPYLSVASNENTERQTPVFALTGTPEGYPTAYQFTTETLVRPQVTVSGTVNFDLAFDLTSDNKVMLYPVRKLVPAPPSGSPVVGLLKSDATFDGLTKAPDKGYTDDSTLVIGTNQVVLVRLKGSGCTYGDPYYAKMQIDTILVSERRLILRTLVNRNCGYRSLVAGVPTD